MNTDNKNTETERCTIPSVSTRFMTVKQLYKACLKHSYILVRFSSGRQMGVNTKIADLIFKKKNYPDNQKTDFVSYLPCGLNEYISKKHVFM